MKSTDLVSLDCTDGLVRRYRRVEGNRPRETGRQNIVDWALLRVDEFVDWFLFFGWLQEFRTAYVPPEEPGPRPTSPLRNAMRAAA